MALCLDGCAHGSGGRGTDEGGGLEGLHGGEEVGAEGHVVGERHLVVLRGMGGGGKIHRVVGAVRYLALAFNWIAIDVSDEPTSGAADASGGPTVGGEPHGCGGDLEVSAGLADEAVGVHEEAPLPDTPAAVQARMRILGEVTGGPCPPPPAL